MADRTYQLSGIELEDWVKKFAQAQEIKNADKYSLKNVILLLNKDLPKRLSNAQDSIYEYYPDGNEWIDFTRLTKSEPNISYQTKVEFCEYLLDKVVAIDLVIKLKNEQGNFIKVAIDVTSNFSEMHTKLQKIQGLPDKDYKTDRERNANIPNVRKALGIDKHLVLVLNNDRRLLPSYEKLLSELQDFANGKSRTGCLDLRDVPEHERFIEAPKTDAMAEVFRQLQERAADLPLAQQLTSIAKSSFLEGFEQSEVKAILTHHPYFQKYLNTGQQRKGEQLAQDFVAKVYEGYLASHHTEVVETIKHCVRKELPDANGAKTHEGKRLILTQAGNTCTVIAKDGRGLIFRQTDGQPTFSRMKQADINAFAKYHESLQGPDNQQQQQRKPGRSR